ncbi:MAG: CPBP family intramembrane metalloprotease [Paracoccus sp. (in: a-proteobacteria)]|uniref:CPBP family intramembrane glutamic endopeptidase n=1 Tax=Paracoccus sp. TaxID=267 RepID=UPI0026DF59CC|nr:CPBP family intramembrane glutamic endopeptidase [Paracoccus sp. (in: a-proteobacteria)]MDO5621808.1 CPBP family intramembrane metalloprotease [Paracoccus sp. (in: a-proteobacteria)]
MAPVAEPTVAINRPLLWAEFTVLFIGAPLFVALCLPSSAMFRALAGFTVVGIILLFRTGGFDWRRLWRGRQLVRWPEQIAFALSVGAVSLVILWFTAPDQIFQFARSNPGMMLMVWLLYPILSALPQELIFRALFFYRYGILFNSRRAAVVTNAAMFSLAHLMYWNLIVAVLTFAGGLIFARAYLMRGFPSAFLAHALAGNMLFLVGMGIYFYSGNVVRPF